MPDGLPAADADAPSADVPGDAPAEAPAVLNGASHPARDVGAYRAPAAVAAASEAVGAPACRRAGRARPGDREERSLTQPCRRAVKPEGHDEIEASKAPLMDHLIELRQRLIYALIGVGIGFAICFAFATDIYNLLVLPYVWARGEGQKIEMIYTAPHEFFFTKLKLALFGAVFLAFPLIAMQVYKFVAPGLYKNERQAFRPYLLWTFAAVHRRRRGRLFHRHAAGHEVLPVDGADGRRRSRSTCRRASASTCR